MADLKKTVDIIFNADDNTKGALSTIGSGLTSFENHLSGVTGPIADVTAKIIKYEAVVAALAAAYAAFSIKEAAEFEQSQIDLAKVLSGSPDSVTESIKVASTEALSLSEDYGIASATILKGIAQFKQSGFTALEAAVLQKSAMDLVIAGGVNASTATNLLTRALIGFKAEVGDATRFTEALNNVSNNYNTNLELLALGMGKISPIASLMGFTFEETAGLITPIIEVFGTGREAAIALKTGLLKLVDDSPKVQDALASIGVSQLDLNGEMRSGRDIFFDVAGAFQSLNEKQKIHITQQIVGIEQAGRMSVVFGNLAKVNEITAVAMAETGSVINEVNLRLASAEVQAKKTWESFTNLSIAIGKEMLPGFNDANEGLQVLLQSFRDVVVAGGLAPIFDELNAQGTEFEAFLKGIAEALPTAFEGIDFTAIIEAFTTLKGSISNIFKDLDLTDPADLTQALQTILDFLSLMVNATAGVVRGFEPFLDVLGTILLKLSEFDPESQEFIGFLAGVNFGIDKLLPLLGFFGSAISLLGTALTAFVSIKLIQFLATTAARLALLNPAWALGAAAVNLIYHAVSDYSDIVDENNAKLEEAAKNASNLKQKIDVLKEATGDAEINAANYNEKLQEFAERTAKAAERIKIFGAEVDVVGTDFTDLNAVIKLNSKVTADWATDLKASDGPLAQAATNIINLGHASGITNQALEESLKHYDDYLNSVQDGQPTLTEWQESFGNMPQVIEPANKAIDKVATAFDKLSEREKLSIENTAKAEQQLVQLASNEKIAQIEFSARIKIADLEADAKKVEAIMGTLTAVFNATAQVIESLVVGFDSSITDADRDFFKNQIEERMRLDKAALEITKKQADAQIELMRAKAQALASGTSLIKIDADSLAPELQAVLRSFADLIRVEAINEGLEILV